MELPQAVSQLLPMFNEGRGTRRKMHLKNICKYSGHDPLAGNDEHGTETMQLAGSIDCLSIILAAGSIIPSLDRAPA